MSNLSSEVSMDVETLKPAAKRGRGGKLAKKERPVPDDLQVVDPGQLPVASSLNAEQVHVWIDAIESIGTDDLTADMRNYLLLLYQRRQAITQLKDGIKQAFAAQTEQMLSVDAELVGEVNRALAGLQEDAELAEGFDRLKELTEGWGGGPSPLELWQSSIAQ